MGLDMYLEAEVRLTHFDDEPESEPHRLARIAADAAGLPQDNAGEGNFGSIVICVHGGYWRKANHIHQWFVREVQDGVDECQRSWVSREKLTELRDACRRVMAASELVPGPVHVGTRYASEGREELIEMARVIGDPATAQELLPAQSGSFFGSTEYTEWYLEDVRHTIAVCDACLACPDVVDFYYQASW